MNVYIVQTGYQITYILIQNNMGITERQSKSKEGWRNMKQNLILAFKYEIETETFSDQNHSMILFAWT